MTVTLCLYVPQEDQWFVSCKFIWKMPLH